MHTYKSIFQTLDLNVKSAKLENNNIIIIITTDKTTGM